MPFSRHPRRTITAGWIVLALCIAVQVAGSLLSGAASTPLPTASPPGTLAAAVASPGGWITTFTAPAMVMSWIAYVATAAGDGKSRRRTLVLGYAAIAACSACAGGLLHFFVSPITVLIGVALLPMGFLSAELKQEGLLCWYAVGVWTWMLIIAYERDARRPRLPAHLCQHCTYDRTGLDPSAPCPECGGRPMLELRRSHRK